MENGYKVGDDVILKTGQKARIFGTKNEPHLPEVDPYGRKEIYPKKDYYVYLVSSISEDSIEFVDTLDIYEHQVEKKGWDN